MLPPCHAGGGLGIMPNPELLAGLVDETTGDTLEDETSRENATKTAVTEDKLTSPNGPGATSTTQETGGQNPVQ